MNDEMVKEMILGSCDLLYGYNTIGVKWVFQIKLKENGEEHTS